MLTRRDFLKTAAAGGAGLAAMGLVGCGSSSSSSSSSEAEETSASSSESESTTEAAETTDEITTLSIFAQNSASEFVDDYGEIAAFQVAEEKLGVEVEWNMPTGSTATEQFNLLIASQDLPDIIFYNFSSTSIKLQGLIDNGTSCSNMDELIREYAPNYLAALETDEAFMKQALSDDGTYQAIYKLEPDVARLVTSGPMIRDDLLEEYGLDIPVTIDDWHQVLAVFKENGITAPFTASSLSSLLSMETFMGAYATFSGMYMDPDTNTIEYGPYTEKYKAWLQEMNLWYTEGLIDPEYSATDLVTLISNLTSGKSAACCGMLSAVMGSTLKSARAENPDFSLAGCPFPVLEEGNTVYTVNEEANVRVGGMGAIITSACENPEKAVEFLDYFYSEEGDALINWGIEGESYVVNEDGSKSFTDEILNNPDGKTAAEAAHLYALPSYGFTKAMDYDAWAQINLNMEEQLEANAVWAEADSVMMLPNLELATEENDEYNSIMNEIDTYVDECQIKFITGSMNFEDDWNTYINQLQKMDIETAIAYKQAAYDKFNAR